MKFNIGDEVKVISTGESGVITDKMYSEAKGHYIYAIKPHDNGRSILRKESDVEPFKNAPTYEVETHIADNVVITVLYEVRNGEPIEVCRGHGHIIHEGAEGVAQAVAYAAKKMFSAIDTGIYYKQRDG